MLLWLRIRYFCGIHYQNAQNCRQLSFYPWLELIGAAFSLRISTKLHRKLGVKV